MRWVCKPAPGLLRSPTAPASGTGKTGRLALRLSLLGGADFVRLWYAGQVACIVRWTETLAVAVFVFQQSRSPFLVAMMTMLRILPMGLFGSVMGAWAERWERRSCLLLVTGMMLLADMALCLLGAFGHLTIWAVAIGCFANGVGWAADNPVRRVAIGEVAGIERMGTAMSIDIAANNGTRIIGPMIGGALLAFAGITAVFAFSAVLYVSAIVVVVGLTYRNQTAMRGLGSVLAGIAEGIRCVRQDRRLFATLLVTVIYNVFAWPFTSMVPVVAEQGLGLGTVATGVIASVDGLGALLGAIAMAMGGARSSNGWLYCGGMVLYCAMITAFALSPSAVPAGAALLLEGIGGAAYSVLQTTLVYRFSPPEMRSRMLGLVSTCIGVGPIGFLHLGWLATAIGARPATAMTGIEGLIAMAVTFPLWRVLLRTRPRQA